MFKTKYNSNNIKCLIINCYKNIGFEKIEIPNYAIGNIEIFNKRNYYDEYKEILFDYKK